MPASRMAAPFARAGFSDADRGLMSRIDRAMFAGVFGLGGDRTAAAIGCFAGNLRQQRFSAIRFTILEHTDGAEFTNGGPLVPLRMGGESAHAAKAGGGQLCRRFR
jgi:hypothetical protein